MKPRRMALAFAACAAIICAFGSTVAQASVPTLKFATGSSGAQRNSKTPIPKEYTLCTEFFGGCGPMYVLNKAKTWETTTICWVNEEFPECPGLGFLHGPFVKGQKGVVNWYFYGPFGEPEVGLFATVKEKKVTPKTYTGSWLVGESNLGGVEIKT